MMKRKKIDIITPSEFYKRIRPEFFSDSEVVYKLELTREVLEFELSKISKDQKQDLFESLCRRLAEIHISPNLIPQVGPTGGGDGKTDSETYPVSEYLSNRWFISNQGWDKGEKWAFAISAKADWRGKVNSDVKKIVDTKRGYNHIYFFTNQTPSSKKKADVIQKIKDKYSICLTIIDREWLLEKIYSNDHIELVVTSLNLSNTYLSKETTIGAIDKERQKRIEELEKNILDTQRYFEYDLQLIEDALESAILSRKIEKPKDEVLGKFERALRLSEKVYNSKQRLRILYQKAFTALNYFDDYNLFYETFQAIKKLFPDEPVHGEIEKYHNLFNLLKVVYTKIEPPVEIDLEREIFYGILNKAINNPEKPTTASIAKSYLAFHRLMNSLVNGNDIGSDIEFLIEAICEGEKHIDFPFESSYKIIDHLGDVISDENFDTVLEKLIEVSSSRQQEINPGTAYFKRGAQKLEKNLYTESIRYFGKAAQRLTKEESQKLLYFSLTGMASAYSSLGLMWASNNCLYIAGSIAFKSWYQDGKITTRIKNITFSLLKNELFIGRISIFLCWNELYKIIKRQLNIQENKLETENFLDACLAVRLVNSVEFNNVTTKYLPEIFNSEELFLSEDASLYILGEYDTIKEAYQDVAQFENNENIDEFFNKVFNQPFRDQMLYDTSFINREYSVIYSKIIGCSFEVEYRTEKSELYSAEFILAFLESFFSTSALDMVPITENIRFKIANTKSDYFDFSVSNNVYLLNIDSIHFKEENKNSWNNLIRIITQILTDCFLIKDEKHLEYLFKEEEISRRLSLTLNHFGALSAILGDNPKLFLRDWIKNETPDYKNRRKESIRFKTEKFAEVGEEENISAPDAEVPHSKMKFNSIIDIKLWSKAHWQAFGTGEDNWGLLILLGFKNKESTIKLFKELKEILGNKDIEDKLKITIIRGIDKSNTNHYRVHISNNIDQSQMKEGNYYTTASKYHDMIPASSKNLDNAIKGYEKHKWYRLVPGYIIGENTENVQPMFDFAIIKEHLHIKEAWQIGINDPDSVVISKTDNPVIPQGIEDAPIIDLLKRKNEA